MKAYRVLHLCIVQDRRIMSEVLTNATGQYQGVWQLVLHCLRTDRKKQWSKLKKYIVYIIHICWKIKDKDNQAAKIKFHFWFAPPHPKNPPVCWEKRGEGSRKFKENNVDDYEQINRADSLCLIRIAFHRFSTLFGGGRSLEGVNDEGEEILMCR